MVKIQLIEKLFSYILEYSFLLIPAFFFLSKSKKESFIIILALYGLGFFFFLHFYYDVPKNFRKFQQALYTLLEYSLFAYLIWYNVQAPKIRRLILYSSLIFFTFHITYYFLSKPQKIDSVPIAVETIILLVYAALYFQQFFKHNIALNIYEYASFWLVVGILIYLGSSFFFNILANNVTQEEMDNFWHFTYIPEIVKNILFALVVLGYPFKKVDKSKLKSLDIPNLDMI